MFMMPALALALVTAATTPPVTIRASIPADAALEEDAEATFSIEIELAEGWAATAGTLDKPIVQIQVPDSCSLDGRYLSSHADLAKNEFIQQPFERLVALDEPTPVPFTVDAAPGESDAFRINVIFYASPGEDSATELVRARVELPVRAGAIARSIASVPATWGEGEEYGPGDLVEGFTLARGDGTSLDISPWLGEKLVLVTTYRAYW